MPRFPTSYLGLLILTSTALLVGCAFFGKPTGQERVQADTLEQEIADYKDWDTPAELEGFSESRHPVPEYVKYYINDIGMSNLADPPDGAIFVKEQFDGDYNYIGLTVMKKIDGYDPENSDWFWAIADSDSEITNAGQLNSTWTSSCIDCHGGADGGDLLFVND